MLTQQSQQWKSHWLLEAGLSSPWSQVNDTIKHFASFQVKSTSHLGFVYGIQITPVPFTWNRHDFIVCSVAAILTGAMGQPKFKKGELDCIPCKVQTWGHWEWNERPLCDGSRPDCSPSRVPLFKLTPCSRDAYPCCRVSIWAALCKNGLWLEVRWLGFQVEQLTTVLVPHLWNRDNNSTLPFKRGQREFSLINEK